MVVVALSTYHLQHPYLSKAQLRPLPLRRYHHLPVLLSSLPIPKRMFQLRLVSVPASGVVLAWAAVLLLFTLLLYQT